PAGIEEAVAAVEARAQLAARRRMAGLLDGDGIDVAILPEGVELHGATVADARLHERTRVGGKRRGVGLAVAIVPLGRAAAAAINEIGGGDGGRREPERESQR